MFFYRILVAAVTILGVACMVSGTAVPEAKGPGITDRPAAEATLRLQDPRNVVRGRLRQAGGLLNRARAGTLRLGAGHDDRLGRRGDAWSRADPGDLKGSSADRGCASG